MRQNLQVFSDGLQRWLHDDDGDLADAAGQNVAEILLMARAWLKAQFKDG